MTRLRLVATTGRLALRARPRSLSRREPLGLSLALPLGLAAFAVSNALSYTVVGMPRAHAQDPHTLDGRPAPGDTAPVSSDTSDPAAAAFVTRFIEAKATQDWARALAAYDELVERWPLFARDVRLSLDRVTVLRKVGRRADAIAVLEGILETEADNIVAIYQLATLDLETADPGSMEKRREEARELLLLAARNGLPVLRELKNEKGPGFEAILKDSHFILAALKAGREFDAVLALATGKVTRNPFLLPAKGKLAEMLTTEKPDTDEDKERKKLKADLAAAARDKDLEREEALRAHQLEILVTRGNECLVAMASTNRERRWVETIAEFERLKAVADEMGKVERDEFQRTAAALRLRGTALRDEAVKRKRIDELNLVVTGIVVDDRPEGRSRSVIVFDDPANRGRIYEIGDEIRDHTDRRVEGLKIVEIRDGEVRFKFEDTEFVRELKTAH